MIGPEYRRHGSARSALAGSGLYVVVVAYAAASVWSELAPDRFSRLFPDRRPPDSR
jgi:hypothetical protein